MHFEVVLCLVGFVIDGVDPVIDVGDELGQEDVDEAKVYAVPQPI